MNTIVRELRKHAPFTAVGALSGIAVMAIVVQTGMSREASSTLFWTFHPLHVFLSALVTAGVYRRHGGAGLSRTLLIGYLGSIGIATLSDSLIPFAGEALLDLPNRGLHLGVLDKWWLVNPLALLGALLAYFRPVTRFPHAGHMLLSTWASLFHIAMAMGSEVSVSTAILIALFLFLSVWIPCCTSDIVFPLLAVRLIVEPSRKRWIEHEGQALVRGLGIGLGDWVLDFGCNWGSYSLPAAKVVGDTGTVIAVDADSKALGRMESRAARLGLRNILPASGLEEAIALAGQKRFQSILLFDVLHMLPPQDRSRLFLRLREVLADDGILSLHPKHLKDDHPSRHFAEYSLEELVREVEAAGFGLRDHKSLRLWHGHGETDGRVLQFSKAPHADGQNHPHATVRRKA